MRLELDSCPESVTLVRGMLGGVGEALAFDAELLDDVRTVVSEACNNVVMHAYGERIGPMVVDCRMGSGRVVVTVTDRGEGIHAVAPAEDRMGVGLAVIGALCERAEFTRVPEGGTEVRMEFAGAIRGRRPPNRAPSAGPPVVADLNGQGWPALSGTVVVRLSPAELLAGVLGRMMRALAARAPFSVDRFSDLYSVTDALAAHALVASAGGRIAFALVSADRRLELRIGPFAAGSSEGLSSRPSQSRFSSPLRMLADELAIERDGTAELLRVVVASDSRRC